MAESTSDQARIEDDLKRTRTRMDRRLTELQERLTPGQLLDDAMEYLRGNGGGDFARNLMASVQSNPLPTALTGIGLAWLMASGTSRPNGASPNQDDVENRLRAADGLLVREEDESDDDYRGRRDDARGKVLGLVREAQDTAESFGRRIDDALTTARQGAHDLRDKASATIGQVGSGAQHAGEQMMRGGQAVRQAGGGVISTVSENPMLLGAMGLALGALLGALVPQSEREEAALGDVAGKVRETAENAAEEVMERGGQVAQQVLAAGSESAREHGLTGGRSVGDVVAGIRSGDLAEDVKQVAQDALHSADGALRDQGTERRADMHPARPA